MNNFADFNVMKGNATWILQLLSVLIWKVFSIVNYLVNSMYVVNKITGWEHETKIITKDILSGLLSLCSLINY